MNCSSIFIEPKRKPENSIYYNINIFYTISNNNTHVSLKRLLIDCDTNSGLVNNNTRIMFTLNHIINIQKINNHRVNNIPIITVAGVVSTQEREIVVLIYQYAIVQTTKLYIQIDN